MSEENVQPKHQMTVDEAIEKVKKQDQEELERRQELQGGFVRDEENEDEGVTSDQILERLKRQVEDSKPMHEEDLY